MSQQIISTYEKRGGYHPLFDEDFITKLREQNNLHHMPYQNIQRNKGDNLFFFYYRKDNKECVVMLLEGSKSNSFYHEPLLMDKEFFEDFLPKLRWVVNYNAKRSRIQIQAHPKNGKEYLKEYLCQYLGLPLGSNLYTLEHPFDIRRVNLTSSNRTHSSKTGIFGVYEHGKLFPVYNRLTCGNAKIWGCTSLVQGQQLHNAMLLYLKKTTTDLHCFGRVPQNGRIAPMFPDKYFPYDLFQAYDFPFLEDHYTGGKLNPEHAKILKEHQHLICPIRDENILSKMAEEGTPLNFTCLDR